MLINNQFPFIVVEETIFAAIEKMLAAQGQPVAATMVAKLHRAEAIPSMEPELMEKVFKAISIGFEISNLVGQYLKMENKPKNLQDILDAEQLETLHSWTDHRYTLTLTCHPTAIWPGDCLAKMVEIASLFAKHTATGKRLSIRVPKLLAQLWQMPVLRKERPTAYDEAKERIDLFPRAVMPGMVKFINSIVAMHAFSSPKEKLQFATATTKHFGMNDWYWDLDGRPVSDDEARAIGKLKVRTAISFYLAQLQKLPKSIGDQIVAKMQLTMEEMEEQLFATSKDTQQKKRAGFLNSGQFQHELETLFFKTEGKIQQAIADILIALAVFGFQLTGAELRFSSKDVSAADGGRDKVTAMLKTGVEFARVAGTKSIHGIIVAGTGNVAEIRIITELAIQAGMPLGFTSIVPLFEDRDAIGRAEEILEQMFNDKDYGQVLNRNGRKQRAMFGCSDGMRYGGQGEAINIFLSIMAANLMCQKFGVHLYPHIGAGEVCSRYGRPLHTAIPTLPFGGMHELWWTMQGHTGLRNCSSTQTVEHTMQQFLQGVLSGCCDNREPMPGEFIPVLADISERNFNKFRELIDWLNRTAIFWDMTPPIGNLKITCRPTKRGASDINQLRAITFNALLYHVRMLLVAWYGLGSTFYAVNDFATLRELHETDPTGFFPGWITSIRQAMLMVDLDVTETYARGMARSEQQADYLLQTIRDEWVKTTEAIEEITQQPLDDGFTNFKARVENRNPTLQQLHMLQIGLMQIQQGDDISPALLQSIIAIVAGLGGSLG